MKYDKDTMNSLQEAYASVNEEKYYSGKDRNKKTGTPKKLQNQTSKTSNKKPKGSMPTGGDGTAYMGEEQEHEGMKYSDKKKIQRQKQLFDASKKAPVVKNKIVPLKTRTEEAIKMSRKEYTSEEKTVKHKMTQDEFNRIPKDFRGGTKEKPRATVGITDEMGNTTPVSREVEIIKKKVVPEGVDKKKEMEDKMKEVEDMRSLPTRMNLIKTKLRAMGLNMSHQLKGKELSEVIDYTLAERNRYEKETGIDTKTGKKIVKGGTAKNDKAFQIVMKKYNPQRMGANEPKKNRGAKPDEGPGKYTIMLRKKRDQEAKNKAFAARAKAAGETPQQRADRMAIYGSEENMEKGIGSGS